MGDSLTAGYGLEDKSLAFPSLIQNKIDNLGWSFVVVNAGLSGETSSGGIRRIDWLLRQKFDVFVLELGANDGLRGIDPKLTRKNLQTILYRTTKEYPHVRCVIAGMQVPPNLGPDYASEFQEIFPALADQNNALLIPFLLEDVGGILNLNLPDGKHPNTRGHEIVAENVWKIIEPLLKELQPPAENQ